MKKKTRWISLIVSLFVLTFVLSGCLSSQSPNSTVGTMIVIKKDNNGIQQLFDWNLTNNTFEQLTYETDNVTFAALSNDEQKIAYVVNQDPSGHSDVIYTINADGGNRTLVSSVEQITNGARDWVYDTISWSPDGKYLYAPMSHLYDYCLPYRIQLDPLSYEQYPVPGDVNSSLHEGYSISENANGVFVETLQQGFCSPTEEIYTFEMNGTNPIDIQNITNDDISEYEPIWFGNNLVFSRQNNDGGEDLVITNQYGSNSKVLVQGGSDYPRVFASTNNEVFYNENGKIFSVYANGNITTLYDGSNPMYGIRNGIF